MKFDLKRPCSNCPFRHDVAPYIRPERAQEIGSALLQGKSFACHKTVAYDEDGNHVQRREHLEQHCAGAMIVLAYMERPNQLMQVASRIGVLDLSSLDMGAPVFRTMQDWYAHIRYGRSCAISE